MNAPNRHVGRSLSSYLDGKAIRKKVPLSGTFELSPVCNFSCKMCYVRKTQQEVLNSPRKILTLHDWLTIAREAREAQQRFFEAIYSGLPREDLLLLRKITQKVIENMDNLEKAELNF